MRIGLFRESGGLGDVICTGGAVRRLQDEGHDPKDKQKAIEVALSVDNRLPTGIFFCGDQAPYDASLPQLEKGPLVEQDITNVDINSLMEKLE